MQGRAGSTPGAAPGRERPARATARAARAWLPRLVATFVLLAFVSWEATLGRFSIQAQTSVGAAIAAAIVCALVEGRGRQRKPSRSWARDGASAAWGDLTGRGRGRAPAPVLVGLAAWVVLASNHRLPTPDALRASA